jgi:hypothetical protein
MKNKIITIILMLFLTSCTSLILKKRIQEYDNLNVDQKEIYNNLSDEFSHGDKMKIIKYF